MFAALLCESDARQATEVVDALLAHGLQCALTGGLAIEAQLRARTLDPKHVSSFRRLRGLGHPQRLADAWNDHRQSVPGTIDEAAMNAAWLLEAHPELIVTDQYSAETPPCTRCRSIGPFRSAPCEAIVEILGYC